MKRTLKKSMSILLAFTLLFGSFAFGFANVNFVDFAVKAEAEETTETFTEGYYTYTVDKNGNVTITDCDTAISGDVVIPSTLGGYIVTSIGDYAFKDCKINTLTFGDCVTNIGNRAFDTCRYLSSINIPKSVTNIGEDAFYWCSELTNITVDSKNPYYFSDEYGVLYNKEKTTLIQYPVGNSRSSYNISDGVSVVANYAFMFCHSLTEITLSESVTKIGKQSFYNNDNIKAIDIPDRVKNIGESAFQNCYGLKSVTVGTDVTNIDMYAFKGCRNLTDLVLGESLTILGISSFENCISLEDVYIPDNVEFIMRHAFYGCKNMKNVTIGNGVAAIKDRAFCDCNNLVNITLPNKSIEIGDNAFYHTSYYYNSDNWENDVLYIKNHLIEAKDNISGLYDIKPGTKSVADRSFSGCESLTEVIIPKGVLNIGDKLFENCKALTNVVIPKGVTSIGVSAFAGCRNLKNIVIPESVTKIGIWAFVSSGVFLDESNWENEVLYIGNNLIYTKKSLSNPYEIKSGTKIIADGAFENCDNLISIIIDDTLTNIGMSAFFSCKSLTDIYYIGSEKEWSEITIGEENECIGNATIHYNYKTTIGSTTEPAEVETTTKPVVEPTTEPISKPIETTKQTTTKPVEVPTTTNPVVEPTKPIVTEPSTTKPVETTKPVVETTTKPTIKEEIIKKPSTSTVKYGETLILHADFTNIPEGATIEWSVEGNGVTFVPSADGKTCAVTSTATGDVTITAKYVDTNGVEHISEQEIKSNASFWQKIVSFFKNLFGINRIIEQIIKF